jgi:hypothetical protein
MRERVNRRTFTTGLANVTWCVSLRPVGDTSGVDATTTLFGGDDERVMIVSTNGSGDAQVAIARTNGGGDVLVVSSSTSCCDAPVVSASADG